MKPQIGIVPEYETAELCSHCAEQLKNSGIYLEQSSDFDKIESFAAEIQKPGITPHLSPTGNDFFETNCFWLLARREQSENSEPLGMIGVRKDSSGRESLAEFSHRKLRALFPNQHNVEIRPDRLPRFASEIRGEVVYMGDLHFSPKRAAKIATRQNLRLFATIAYCLIQLKWPNLNWVYAFIRDQDARRAALWIYRARHQSSFAHSWTQEPSVDEYPHWLLASEKTDLEELLLSEIAHLKRNGVIQYP